MTGSRVSDRRSVARVVLVLLACLFLSAAGCAREGDDDVLAVEKTKTYHRAECPRVMMAHAEWMTREEARALDFKPCPDCRPDSRR